MLRIAERTGCSVTGVDIHEQAIATANSLAAKRGLTKRAQFQVVNATAALPFPDASFDAITCIDAINHLPDRPRVIADWVRLLKPGGRMLFTDSITVTGPLTNDEIAVRGSIGFFLFVPRGYDERVIADCGLPLDGPALPGSPWIPSSLPGVQACRPVRWRSRRWITRARSPAVARGRPSAGCA